MKRSIRYRLICCVCSLQLWVVAGPMVAEELAGTVTEQNTVTPIAGAAVEAWDVYPCGNMVGSDVTGADGSYSVSGLSAGHYDVRVHLQDYCSRFSFNVPAPSADINFSLNRIPPVTPTDTWTDFHGLSTTFLECPVHNGDVVTAVDPDDIVCGVYYVTNEGWYGIMPVYGDDDVTPEDEGAQAGDSISFYVNCVPASIVSGDPIWTGGSAQVELAVEPSTFCEIIITTPNGGEICCVATQQQITWTSQQTSGSICIDYSSDGGQTWIVVAEGEVDDGTYTWTIPDLHSDNCLVRVCDCEHSECCDVTDDPFTICGEPQADFSGTPQSETNETCTVQFTDLSADCVTDWEWDFGDGESSVSQNPSHTFACDSAYTVSLTVSGPCGQNTEIKTDYISCTCPPQCPVGDVNCDGNITPGDALCAFWRAILGQFQEECSCECSEQAAEVNCDGNITPGDALCIFWRSILGDWTEECQCEP